MIDLDLFFLIPQDTLQWQLILGEICKMHFIRQADMQKRIGIWQFQLKIFNGDILATSCDQPCPGRRLQIITHPTVDAACAAYTKA